MADEAVVPPVHNSLKEHFNRVDKVAPAVIETAKLDEVIPATEPVKPEASAKPNLEELTDEEVTALLEKRTGRKFASLDELREPPKAPTKEELEALEVKERTEALEWALGTDKIKKDFYDKSITDKSKSKREIALHLFTQELQGENKDLTAEECEELFSDFYAEGEDEKSWKHIKGAKEMNALADNYLSQYASVDKLPEEYRAYKTTAEKQKTYNKQIKSLVKEIPAELSFKVPYETIDGGTAELEYKVPVDESVISKLTAEFTTPQIFSSLSEEKPERILTELNFLTRSRMMDKAIPVIMAEHAKRVEMDVMAKLKNARNPQQNILGQQTAPTGARTAPPEHKGIKAKMNK